jgi:hypothetical protein
MVVGHTVRLSLAARSSFYPHFGQRTGATRVSNWYSPNKRELKVPSFTCLHFHFHFSLQLTTTNRIKFSLSCLFPCTTLHFFTISQRIGTVCPLECAALTGLLPQESSSSFYPHFGQRTGAKRASNWYSTRTQKSNSNLHFFIHTLFCLATTTVPTFTFSPENRIGVSVRVRSTH